MQICGYSDFERLFICLHYTANLKSDSFDYLNAQPSCTIHFSCVPKDFSPKDWVIQNVGVQSSTSYIELCLNRFRMNLVAFRQVFINRLLNVM